MKQVNRDSQEPSCWALPRLHHRSSSEICKPWPWTVGSPPSLAPALFSSLPSQCRLTYVSSRNKCSQVNLEVGWMIPVAFFNLTLKIRKQTCWVQSMTKSKPVTDTLEPKLWPFKAVRHLRGMQFLKNKRGQWCWFFFRCAICPDWLLTKHSPDRSTKYMYSQCATILNMVTLTETRTLLSKA